MKSNTGSSTGKSSFVNTTIPPPVDACSVHDATSEKERRLVPLGDAEVVPLKLQLGRETIEVILDADGLHFRQAGNTALGHLSWEKAIAMSLVPEEWRPLIRSA